MSGFVIVQFRADGRMYLESSTVSVYVTDASWTINQEDALVFRDRQTADFVASHFQRTLVVPQ